MEHRQQAQREQCRQHCQQSRPPDGRRLGEADADRLAAAHQGPGGQGQQAHRRIGQQGGEEVPGRQVEVPAQEQVLGIAHGSGHAAQVGGRGLQDHRGQDSPALPGQLQDLEGEGDEGDQGHVVGDEHGGEKGQQHQKKLQQADVFLPCQQAL